MKGALICHCSQLRRAARIITRLYDEKLAPAGLTAAQYALVRAIHRAGTSSLTKLGAALDLDRSTLGRNLRALEKVGIVKMAWGADLRERSVSLTAKGTAAMEAGIALWRQAQHTIEDALGPALLEQMTRVTEELEALRRQE